jgi:uncharacterized Zn finger protein
LPAGNFLTISAVKFRNKPYGGEKRIMARFSRSWWGKRFIDALESFTDAGRLSRGRSYASGGKIRSYTIVDGVVTAHVRGSINAYFGVTKEPLYITTIEMQPISAANWKKAIAALSSRASFVAKLLMNEIPDNVEEAFAPLKIHLLPHHQADFKTACSCPDWTNPCKHIAGVYYLLASQLDQDPFLLFELRGLSRNELQAELAKSPLGQVLSQEMTAQAPDPEISVSYYTRPQVESLPTQVSLKEFWQGQKRLPQAIEVANPAGIEGVLIKKQGDYPAFWRKDHSFIEVMEDLYERVKTKNRDLL